MVHYGCVALLFVLDLPHHDIEICLHLVQVEAPLERVVLNQMLALPVAVEVTLLKLDLVKYLLDARLLIGIVSNDVVLQQEPQYCLKIRLGVVVKLLYPEEHLG